MKSPVVQLSGIGKTFPATASGSQLGAWWRALRGVGHARGRDVLRNVSLQLTQGESVAILGENGAGKTTLLKIIAGILVPTAGSCRVHGAVGAMLELGAGFQPELTGRQNLRNACVLAGIEGDRLAAAQQQVTDFSGLHEAMEQPLKHYSSGMVVRLGFAVMTAVNPQLLISDEVLAVGDEAFQKKCINWVQQYLAGGGSLLLVSHSIYHVQKLCERAVWLHDGQIRMSGDVFAVSQSYLSWHEARLSTDRPQDTANCSVTLDDVTATIEQSSQQLRVAGRLQGADSAGLGVELRRTDGALLAACRTRAHGGHFDLALQPPERLLPGRLRLEIWPQTHHGQASGPRSRCLLQVEGQAREFGCVRLPHHWGPPAK